jgi:TPR repeat protein
MVVLLVYIAFFVALSLASWLSSKTSFVPSVILSGALCILLASIVLYPRILAIQAKTPQEHLVAAHSLEAAWRMPFESETAAWSHYLLAAEGGIPEAESTVGGAYLYGWYGAPFDRAKARYWLEAAASHGDVEAKRNLKEVDAFQAPYPSSPP